MAAGEMTLHRATHLALYLATVISFVYCGEHFIVTHTPEYLHFQATGDYLRLSEVPALVATTLGYSLQKDLSWRGLTQTSFFKRPKANVLISVDGFKDAHLELNLHHVVKYPTISDDAVINTELVGQRLQRSHESPLVLDFSSDNTVFDVKSEHPTLFAGLSSTMDKVQELITSGNSLLNDFDTKTLNASDRTDLVLLSELHLIQEILQTVKKDPELIKDKSPDLYHFHLGGLKALVDGYGSKSTQVSDAISLLRNFLTKMTKEFRTLYNDNVVVEIVTQSGITSAPKRKGRSLLEDLATGESTPNPLNLDVDYDPEFEALFNITFWTMLALVLTVVIVNTGIWNMDPGRDSIIYRMTSQRIKKE